MIGAGKINEHGRKQGQPVGKRTKASTTITAQYSPLRILIPSNAKKLQNTSVIIALCTKMELQYPGSCLLGQIYSLKNYRWV